MSESVEQQDPTEEVETSVVKERAVKGAAILTIRTIFMQAVSFFANALLTIFLLPAEYGVFFIVSAVINFLAYFSDIGFAASLIQKKEKLTNQELRTIFTTQQILIIALLILVFTVTPFIQNFYKFDQESVYLLWALAFSLFTSSLKTIPSVLLERRLEFNKLVIPQITETIVFNVVAVYLAFNGFGVTSFTFAVLARAVVGLVLTYLIQPWLPAVAFSKSALKSTLKFGIPYQMNVFLAVLKDDGMTIFLGGILGLNGVGLLGWAQKWAYAPLRFFMDQVIKVTFPAFSRFQDDKKELSDIVSKSIFFICLLVFPSLVLLNLLAPALTQVIPKYNQWIPALVALMLISSTSALAAVTTPITNMLNAIGKISLTFKFMIMWTILTWAFVPGLSVVYGVSGAGLGFALVGASSIFALWKAKEFIEINYFKIMGIPTIGSIIMGVIVFTLQRFLSVSLSSIIILLIVGLISYSVMVIIFKPELFRLVTKRILKYG